MENNQKPEWFELAENDQPVSRPLKSKKSAPMRNLAFILAGILVIPMGAGVALLTHDSKSANAVETLNLTQDSPAATSSPQTMTSNAISMPTASRDDDDDDEEGNGDNYRAAAFSNSVSSSAPVATPSSAQSNQNTPAAPATKAPAVTAPAVTAPAAITPPESASKDLILPPTKKVGDDDEDDDEKCDGKKSKKSDRDDDDEDDEDDEDDD